MKVLELFCGTKSISKAFEKRRHETFTVDFNEKFEPTLCADILTLTPYDIIELCDGVPDIIWASPDCTSYSIAGITHHRRKNLTTGELEPISEYAKYCDDVNKHLVDLINRIRPRYFFIENPRGGLRKMKFMRNIPRYTITYCQYGDFRMKPTDIWTNHPDPQFKPPCKNGDSCHEHSPRRSNHGTQGIKNRVDRSRIPDSLCEHICDICERG